MFWCLAPTPRAEGRPLVGREHSTPHKESPRIAVRKLVSLTSTYRSLVFSYLSVSRSACRLCLWLLRPMPDPLSLVAFVSFCTPDSPVLLGCTSQCPHLLIHMVGVLQSGTPASAETAVRGKLEAKIQAGLNVGASARIQELIQRRMVNISRLVRKTGDHLSGACHPAAGDTKRDLPANGIDAGCSGAWPATNVNLAQIVSRVVPPWDSRDFSSRTRWSKGAQHPRPSWIPTSRKVSNSLRPNGAGLCACAGEITNTKFKSPNGAQVSIYHQIT